MAANITEQPAQKPMEQRGVLLLVAYLLMAAVMSAYMIISLWPTQRPIAAGDAPRPDCGTGTAPRLTNIHAASVSVGWVGDVLLIGCRFPAMTQVKVNGIQRQAQLVDTSYIRVGLTAGDVSAIGTVVFTLLSPAAEFGTGTLNVVLVC